MHSRLALSLALMMLAGLLVAPAFAAVQASQRWYAEGYYNAWSNGAGGSVRPYANNPYGVGFFTSIYLVIVFPNFDWFAVGYWQGWMACDTSWSPTWFTDQSVSGQYSCVPITNRFPSTGSWYPYQVYNVPGTTLWNGVINAGLVRTTAFSFSYGTGHGSGEANGDSNQMNSWFASMESGRVRGGTTIYWYDWPSLLTHQNWPYYVTVISSKEFKTASSTHP